MMKDTLFTKTVGLYFRYGNCCSKDPQPECSGAVFLHACPPGCTKLALAGCSAGGFEDK